MEDSLCKRIAATFLLLALYFICQASAIGCFVCTSINNSTPACEDTFHNTHGFYQASCKAGRKGRSGLFPATQCVKFKAHMPDHSKTVLVRACVVDNGDINSETEIGRSNHCGMVDYLYYNKDKMKGCVLSCNTDGCNGAKQLKQSVNVHVWVAVSFVVFYLAGPT